MSCKVNGCAKSATRRDGHCDWHYRKNRNGATCSISGCNGVVRARGWCGKHWQRWKANGDPEAVQRVREREYGHTRINNAGYVVEYVPGHVQADPTGKALQHRRVMADHMERPLEEYENVHHKNGVRSDNRLENLELWVVRQPYGQRVEDLLEWADWIIERYRSE